VSAPESVAVCDLLRHRSVIERAVTDFLGRAWRIERVDDLGDRASHPAAVLSGGATSVFEKLGRSELVADQFAREREGLAALTSLGGVTTPTVIDMIAVDGGAILLMEAVETVERQPGHWRHYGEALARLHAVKSDAFGFETHCYGGDFLLDNGWLADWAEFFWLRRAEPRLRGARDRGDLPAGLARQVDELGARLDSLCGPRVTPSLVHGDAHQNNVLATADGPVFIDPSAHYGHPEMDLAFLDYFEPVHPELFRGYASSASIDPGFDERRELWRLPVHLAMIEVEGAKHIDRLRDALSLYS
jgi:fructosamine-3-kinase